MDQSLLRSGLMAHEHHEWLADLNKEIIRDHERDKKMAREKANIQQIGHRVEAHWLRPLSEWLPRQYTADIGSTRRMYILLEDDDGGTTAETDLVVVHPQYPQKLRLRDTVVAGGVAAAFSVKRRVDRKALIEASQAAVDLRRGMKIRGDTLRESLVPPVFYGLLAESHVWQSPKSTPAENVTKILWEFDQVNLESPREGLDFVCIADLGCWVRRTDVWMKSYIRSQNDPLLNAFTRGESMVMTGMYRQRDDLDPATGFGDWTAIAVFIGSLWAHLALNDHSLKPIADGLRFTKTTGLGRTNPKRWRLADIVSPLVFDIAESGSAVGPDWGTRFPPPG